MPGTCMSEREWAAPAGGTGAGPQAWPDLRRAGRGGGALAGYEDVAQGAKGSRVHGRRKSVAVLASAFRL